MALRGSRRWVAAVGIALAALLVRHVLSWWIGYDGAPFFMAFPAVVLAAWYGGLGPGLLALAIGLGGTALLAAPAGALPGDAPSQVRLLIGVPTLVLVCIVCGQLHRARRRAEARADTAEATGLVEQHLRIALDAARVSVYDMDRDLRYTRVHRPAFGLAVADVIGKTAEDVFASQPEVAERLTRIRREVMATGRSVNFELSYLVRGELAYFDVVISPLYDVEGRLAGVTNASMPITERKRAEERAQAEVREALERERAARKEAEAANRLKDEFLSTLSHELRTPLNAILGWSQILLSERADAETARQGVRAIDRAARNQASLVEDLLDMNAILAGKVRLETQPLDAGRLVERAVDTVVPIAREKRVTIDVDAPAGLPPVAGDPRRLQQVLWNLLHNAVKFSEAGGDIVVRARRADATIAIDVIDRGRGIAPEFLPHVFDRFRQEDASVTRSHGGLGLGLSIVRHLVQMHGGQVEAASDGLGKGARFTVRLPLATASLPIWRETGSPQTVASLAGRRVLVVDDDTGSREVACALLTRAGAVVEAAGDAEEALARLRGASFDVLVSDIAMPAMDGLELLRRVREELRIAPERMPAIALSARAGSRDREQVLAAGFRRLVAKPVEAEALLEAIA